VASKPAKEEAQYQLKISWLVVPLEEEEEENNTILAGIILMFFLLSAVDG
jgi:hypothetical protein